MHRNYCFRRKQHSYVTCDAALAASLFIKILFAYVYSVEFFCSGLSSNPNGFSTSKAA